MLNFVRKLGKHIGRRGVSAFIFAYVFFTVGMSYVVDVPTANGAINLETLTMLLPLHVWGWLWVAASLLLLVCVWFKKLESIGFSLAMILSLAWALGITAQTLFGEDVRGYVSAAFYLLVAAFIYVVSGWAEPKYLDGDDVKEAG